MFTKTLLFLFYFQSRLHGRDGYRCQNIAKRKKNYLTVSFFKFLFDWKTTKSRCGRWTKKKKTSTVATLNIAERWRQWVRGEGTAGCRPANGQSAVAPLHARLLLGRFQISRLILVSCTVFTTVSNNASGRQQSDRVLVIFIVGLHKNVHVSRKHDANTALANKDSGRYVHPRSCHQPCGPTI